MWLVWMLAMAWGSTAEQKMFVGDVAGALEAARAEADTAPEDVEAQEELIDLLLNLYLMEEAVERANGRIEKNPESPDAHYLLGRALPDPAPARAAYERALRLDPTHARSHMGIGAIYTAQSDAQRAAGAYGRAVRIDPSLAEAWLGLSRAHLGLQNIDEAVAVSRKAMTAIPNHPDAYLTVAILQPEHAAEVLEQAAANAGQDARVHAALSEVLLDAGQAKRALKSAERSLSINPGEAVAMRVKLFAGEMVSKRLSAEGYRALVAAREKNDVPAHDALVKANPKSTSALLARSRAFRAVGNDAAAFEDLAAARRLSPKEPEVLGQIGLLLLDLQRPAEAVEPLGAARAARPWDGSLTASWAKANSLSGQHTEALLAYKGLIKQSPYDSELAIAYADALLRAKKPEAAYQVVLNAAEQRMDERLVVALMATAAQAGRFAEAADIMQQIADKTNNPKAAALAEQLRAKVQK